MKKGAFAMETYLDLVGFFLISLMVPHSCSRINSAPRQPRLSSAESVPYYFYSDIDGHPGTYSYGYDVRDPTTGNSQFKSEERYPNGTVVGSYGYTDAWGRPRRYRYVADERGYRVLSDVPYKPYVSPSPVPVFNPGYPSETSITWTRSKKINKKKYNNYYTNRPNLVGPPSAYVED